MSYCPDGENKSHIGVTHSYKPHNVKQLVRQILLCHGCI